MTWRIYSRYEHISLCGKMGQVLRDIESGGDGEDEDANREKKSAN
jgi:hypothetical protein